MSVDANALERETLERKDRDELAKIAAALGGKVTTRTRKGEMIDLILDLTGVTGRDSDAGEEAAKTDDEKGSADAGASSAATTAKTADAEAKPDDKDDKGSRRDKSPDQDKASDRGRSSERDKSTETKASEDDHAADESDAPERKSDSENDAAAARAEGANGQRRRRRGRNREAGPPDEFTGEPIPVAGCLDLRDDGYGFLRVDGMLPSKDDCYVSVKLVREYGLRKGDVIAGGSRPAFRNEKNPAILRIDTVNDLPIEPGTHRPLFEDLTATFATEPITLGADSDDTTGRALDALAPVGKGSRVLVAGPSRAGKTSVLTTIAQRADAAEDLNLIVVLIDERPEEITEIERVVDSSMVYGSAFDAPPEDHAAMVELALARARRIAEGGDDVVVIIDGLTRLARAAHASGHASGRTVGGIDTNAINTAKRAFGAGRNLEEAGSVTLVATASYDTGSEMDAAIYDAIAEAATTQVVLNRSAAERRSFPALDVGRTSTRREDLLVGEDGAEDRDSLRKELAGLPDPDSADHADGLDSLLGRLRATKSNDELFT